MYEAIGLRSLLAIWAFGASVAAGAGAHAVDLTHWKLTLPVDAAGSSEGKAVEVQAAELVNGFQDQRYFIRGDDGSLVFWAPVTGATTKGSDYPRSELREVIDPNDDNVNWTTAGRHSLEATCIVEKVPSSQKVIIGQIHGFTGKARPLIKLQYFKGKINALVKLSPNADKEIKLLFGEVGLGKPFDYQILVEDGKLVVRVNKESQTVDVLKNDPAWAEQTLYFKAGAYTQDNEGEASEGAKVIFTRLVASHS